MTVRAEEDKGFLSKEIVQRQVGSVGKHGSIVFPTWWEWREGAGRRKRLDE